MALLHLPPTSGMIGRTNRRKACTKAQSCQKIFDSLAKVKPPAENAQFEFDWMAKGANELLPPRPAASMVAEVLPSIPDEFQAAQPTVSKGFRRSPAVLPVSKPLPSAIGRGHFGEDEHGPIRPSPAEVRAITENHAERLINLLEGLVEVEAFLANSQCSDRARLYHESDRLLSAYQGGIPMYVEDFGEPAVNRLDAYARHQHGLR